MATAKPATKPANRKFGSQRNNVRRTIVARRNKGQAWRVIAADLGIAPRTVRRLFDEAKGTGAHFDAKIGKGGRTRTVTLAEANPEGVVLA